MGTLNISSKVFSFSYSNTRRIATTNKVKKIKVIKISNSSLPNRSNLVAELDYLKTYTLANNTTAHLKEESPKSMDQIIKLHLIMEIVEERLEMHKNIGIQRDNWNHLLLTSINMMTLSAASMTALAAVASTGAGASLVALKVSSTILYMAATGLLVFMNKVQPSQLGEEQRIAARLFKQLHGEIKTRVVLGNANEAYVNEAMEKVLAIDKAYPLPLLGSMLEKFPQIVQPAVWWPQRKKKHQRQELKGDSNNNGWDAKLEEEMKKIVMVIKKKDKEDYMRLSKEVLNFNKVLAFSGPMLTGLAALGSCCLGSVNATWPVVLGIVCGSLASVVNTLEHGGQVGMVFEMYRANAGFFKLMEETIEHNINEEDYEKRENGELFELKVALQLGRSLSELRQFSDKLSSSDEENACDEEFAGKIF